MKICITCNNSFPHKVQFGKKIHLSGNRSRCYNCSPIRSRNGNNIHNVPNNISLEEQKKINTLKIQRRGQQKLRESRNNRKAELVKLKGGCCQKCGYNKCLASLCFHHRNSQEKLFNIDRTVLNQYKWERILEEVNKCDLLCSNCHNELHYLERDIYRKETRPNLAKHFGLTVPS